MKTGGVCARDILVLIISRFLIVVFLVLLHPMKTRFVEDEAKTAFRCPGAVGRTILLAGDALRSE